MLFQTFKSRDSPLDLIGPGRVAARLLCLVGVNEHVARPDFIPEHHRTFAKESFPRDLRYRAQPALNLLTGLDVKVWFSEKDLPLGTPFMPQIDKGLAKSRAGIVLVTPALLASLESQGVAEKELSVLLGTGRVIPIAHGTTFDALREISPMLASHHGITTSDYTTLDEVATKIADTVLLDDE